MPSAPLIPSLRHHAACSHSPLVADEDALKQRDSSIKRNTTLVKKLRSITEEGREALLKELKTTNTSKARGVPSCVSVAPPVAAVARETSLFARPLFHAVCL